MFIEYVFGPRQGQQEHISREDARTLILGGFAKEAIVPPAPIKPPTFGIWRGNLSDVVALQFHCDACQRTDYFGGPATDANFAAIARVLCTHAKGGVPKETRDSYAYAVEGKEPASARHMSASAVVGAGGSLSPGTPYRIVNGEKVPA